MLVDEIKSSISIIDICDKYGLKRVNKNFISCPFHGEKTPSLKLYPNTNSWHCFGCGKGGDAITFVELLLDQDFSSVCKTICNDFGLTGSSKPTLTSLKKRKEIEHKIKEREEQQKAADDEYWKIYDAWARYDMNIRLYAPKKSMENLHPLFIEACTCIDYYKYMLDCAETKRGEIID